MHVIVKDCLALKSFEIMDYSMLMGIHNIDLAEAEIGLRTSDGECGPSTSKDRPQTSTDARSSQMDLWKSLQSDFNTKSPHEEGRIAARNAKGERLLIFLGIIDILQSYRVLKKLEYKWKSFFHDGDTISVQKPLFYAKRFETYMKETVFRVAIEECASKTRKNVPLKNEPLGKRIKSRSVAGKDDGHPEDGVENPITSSTRSSYYKSGEKKKKNRLFATAEQTAPLAKAEDDDLEMDIVTKTLS